MLVTRPVLKSLVASCSFLFILAISLRFDLISRSCFAVVDSCVDFVWNHGSCSDTLNLFLRLSYGEEFTIFPICMKMYAPDVAKRLFNSRQHFREGLARLQLFRGLFFLDECAENRVLPDHSVPCHAFEVPKIRVEQMYPRRKTCNCDRRTNLSSATHLLSIIFPATDSLRSALPLTFTATAAKLLFSGGGGTITPAGEWSSLGNARTRLELSQKILSGLLMRLT